MPTKITQTNKVNASSINISVLTLQLTPTTDTPLIIESESGEVYDDSFIIKCAKPISLQKNKHLLIEGGLIISTPQPVDKHGDKIIAAPYHIEWKIEPNIEMLIKHNIWAYGSSGSITQAELKFVLVNFGSTIFNAARGTTIATLQFYLVPKLQIL